MDKNTQALLDAREILRKNIRSKQEEESDQIRALMIEGINIHKPPGELSTFCDIIGADFERREGCEIYRLIGALGAAQIIMGRNVLTPTMSKTMYQLMLVAPSGGGKSAALSFISSAATSLGLEMRFRGSTVTSLKQLQVAVIEGEGALVYLADDVPSHVLNWDNERSTLDGISSFFRSESTSQGAWMATAPIRRELDETLEKSSSPKMLEGKARAEGWILPRVDATKEIDFVTFSKQNQDVAKRYAKAKKDVTLAEKPVERMKLIPVIAMTPNHGKKIIENWQDNGSMGRTFFICNEEETGEFKDGFDEGKKWNSGKFVREWKARIPMGPVIAKWGDGSQARFRELARTIDSLRNEGGITGSVSARYAQMLIDLATTCAFFDTNARSGNDFFVNINHLDWGYQACLKSLLDMRDYMEGHADENGLEVNEWEAIVSKVKSCVETNGKFMKYGTVSTMKDRVCRDRVKLIIDACTSSGMLMTKEKFMYCILECIGNYRHAPVAVDDSNTSKVAILEGGRWNDIPMTNEMRNLLSTALRRIKFLPKK